MMIPSRRSQCWQFGLASVFVVGGAITLTSAIAFSETGAFAQVTPDPSLGTVVTPNVTPNGTTFQITGGATAGDTNLFHSFENFSIPDRGIADFLNAPAIANILARVTGGSPSDIQGLIRAGGNANLFLINPNGIIFGPNAQLDIGGSFVGTTANAIAFPGGAEFSLTSAVSPDNPLLIVNPSALVFNQIVAQPTNSIEVRGTLAVDENQSLLLIGGNVSPSATSTGKISIQGGFLDAPGGRVELGGLLGTGTVGLNVDGNNLRLSFPDSVARADVSLTDGANVNVRAAGGGSIIVNAQNLNMAGGSQLQAGINSPLGLPESKAGDIEIIASDTISFDGVGSNGLSSGVFSTVERGAVGNGGNISITTESLSLTNGAVVSAETFAQGDGGSIRITASDTLFFDGLGSNGLSSGLLSGTKTPATGKGGDITVTTNVLRLANGAVLSARTWNLYSGGNITVDTNNLELSGGGQLLTTAYSIGAAGNITVNATDGITISGSDPTFNDRLVQEADPSKLDQADAASGVFADTIQIPDLDPTGEGGNIILTTEQLIVREGGKVAVSTEGSGDAGDLWIQADSIRLDTAARLEAETKSQQPDSPEGQGNITLLSQELVLRGGSNITTNATNTATGGNITIDTDVIAALEDSDISANAQDAFGGRVIITAQGILGTEFREEQTPQSDITATSELGPEFSGTVEINTPDVDPSRGLAELPTIPVDTEVAQGCSAGGSQAQSEFIITGRGGLPPNPGEALNSDAVQVDLVTLNPRIENRSIPPQATNPTKPTGVPLVEAQGWVMGANSKVLLTANAPDAPTVTPHRSWQKPPECGVN
ncbi:filamentous hemagglutinin N-terminal domain-containing protein [Coleofasciculus sp. FACHB-712]|uniref:two-partner secretion domain-containing protein n=1 Tax=Coleofasciculus sp. FACHB-712 TaxID=2692789 RepID=UPI001681CEBB|nr:filamentous hemagglutinin N-terminal domain-containing protein [Coleofasciculus sp. FACHB-712]MBD1944069.1 filamentous hemagglutinin N-terminal domain-containing protein [Coleofasciculus sp. FACHB-712]